MPIAILIGFEYTFNSLTGALVDLYHAFKWCQSFNCDIHVFTDIELVKDYNNLRRVIDLKIAEPDILSFYERIPSMTIVRNRTSLLRSLIRILENVSDDKVIIYYSGHGVKDSMVMPDKTLLSFINFRDTILDILQPYVEIFLILDCCNPNGMRLPYKLNNNCFTLSTHIPNDIECVSQPILLITSSESNEKSIATKSGSIFSRHLFRILTQFNKEFNNDDSSAPISLIPIHKNRNLRRLMGNLMSSIRRMHTGYTQTVSIYSSYIIDPVLWMWIGSEKDYDLVTDITLSMLILRNNKSSKNNSSQLIRKNHHDETINPMSYLPFMKPSPNSRLYTNNNKIKKTTGNHIQDTCKLLDTPHIYNSDDHLLPNHIMVERKISNPYDLIYPE